MFINFTPEKNFAWGIGHVYTGKNMLSQGKDTFTQGKETTETHIGSPSSRGLKRPRGPLLLSLN